MGLLRSSWWLILGLFLHLTHLLASMLPPIVAVTLVVQSQAGYWLSFSAICTSASLPPPHPSLPCPLSHNSMNTFLVCLKEHLGAHHVIICLSCFVSLPSVSAHEICGEGAFSVDGALRRPKRNAQSFASQRYCFYCTEKYPHFSPSKWDRSNAGGVGGFGAIVPFPHLERSATPQPGVSLLSACHYLTVAQTRETQNLQKDTKGKRSLGEVWMEYKLFLLPKHWRKCPEKLSMPIRE